MKILAFVAILFFIFIPMARSAPLTDQQKHNQEWPGESLKIGMTANEVVAILGEPDYRNRTVSGSGTFEQWVYGRFYLPLYVYIRNGKLTAWQE